jgi:single-strand DNA-binding protein
MINKVILIGRVGKDPEVRHLDNNLVTARFSLATDETYRNKDGEKTTQTEWHNIVAWRQVAEIAEKYVTKGKLLYIEGRIRSRSWEKDGVKHYSFEIEAETIRFLSSPSDGASKPTEPPQIKQVDETPLPPAPADDLPF